MARSADPVLFAGMLFLGIVSTSIHAGEVEIAAARAECTVTRCTFHVTLRHADSGWEHYADLWRVLTPQGEELGRRVLLHPHVDEQPFTRGESMTVPSKLDHVLIEAHDKVHGYATKRFRLDLPKQH
jgi:hypothetical protein